MKFKDLRKKVEEAVEIGKPETTKAYASMTPGQPAQVVFTPPPEVDGKKIAAELDPAGGIEHNIKHALSRQDKDEDGDVDSQDAHTPDEVPQDDKKNQTLHLLKKGAAERKHTKKGVAYESVQVDEAMTPQQKSDFDRMMAGAMSRAAYNAKWKKPLKSDDKVIYGKNVKEEFELTEDQAADWERIQAMDKGSVIAGKEGARKKLAHLNAVLAFQKKYGKDTLKTKKEIERINQSRVAEDTEVMVEKLSASDDMSKWIDDFQKSDAPQFAGKSKEERRKMAIAAKMSADRDAGVKEDTDLSEDYFTVVYKDKNGKVQSEKNFTSKDAADKYAARGNGVDKVGGKYHVYSVKGTMESVELDEASTYDKTSPAHQAAKKTIKGMSGHARAEYHPDGSATVHTKTHNSISSTRVVDHHHDTHKLGYNRSEADYKNSSHSANGLTHKTTGSNATGHTIHITASKPQHESVEHISEGEDKTVMRLKQLVRFGLMDKSKLPLLSRAINNLEKGGTVTNPTERQVLFDLLNELIGVVTGDDAMFAKVRMSVQNEDFDAEE